MKKAEVKKGKKKNVLKEYWPLYLMNASGTSVSADQQLYPMAGNGDCV